MLSRHRYAVDRGIDDDVWRVPVIPHPFVHGTDKVRAF
jgi:hypothetical protein